MGPIKGCPRGNYKTLSLKPHQNVFCYYCNKCFKRRAILEHHIKTKHLNYRVSCPACGKEFTSKSVWHRHMANVHAIKSYEQINVTLAPLRQIQMEKDQSNSYRKELHPFLNMSFENDKAFPAIANVPSIAKKNDVFGVHMVANSDIDVGKVIIVSSAFASVECLTSVDCCFHCGKPRNRQFLQCPHCINTFFVVKDVV